MSIDWVQGSPDELRRKLTNGQLFARPARQFLEASALVIEGYARENAPVDTGRLRGSIAYSIDSSPTPLYAKVGTNVAYAPYMEYGTGQLSDNPSAVAGWQFPKGPELDVWAKRHGFEKGAHVADIIRWKGGLEPRRYLRRAMETSKSAVRRLLKTMAAEIERIWRQA